MTIIPWWLKAVALAVFCAALYGGGAYRGWHIKDYADQKALVAQQQKTIQEENVLKQQIAALEVTKKKDDKELQDALSNTKVVTQYVTKTVTKEVNSNPVYKQCLLPASGVSVLNDEATKFNQYRGLTNNDSGN